jgi:hypothetical protein
MTNPQILAIDIILLIYAVSIKPNPSREGDGKRRILRDQDGRAAEDNAIGEFGLVIWHTINNATLKKKKHEKLPE